MLNLFLIFVGLSTMWVFMFKINWLFGFKKPFWFVLLYSALLYFLSFTFLRLGYFDHLLVAILKVPLISLVIFKALCLGFNGLYGRNPENTAWSFEKKSMKDVIFSLLFWFLGVGMPIYLIAIQFPKQP